MDAGSSGSVPTKIVIIEKICFFPNQKPPSAFSLAHPSNDTPGSNVPPKIPARSKTPLRSVKKGTPDVTPDESAAGAARKHKAGGGGGGAAGGQAPPHGDARAESASDTAQSTGPTNAASAKEAKKTEAVPVNPMPAVKTVPPSPKVYVRKVKGKAKKEHKP